MRWCCVSQAATLEQLLIWESCHLAISYSGSALHGMNLCAACRYDRVKVTSYKTYRCQRHEAVKGFDCGMPRRAACRSCVGAAHSWPDAAPAMAACIC
jgi:hypothetical protein